MKIRWRYVAVFCILFLFLLISAFFGYRSFFSGNPDLGGRISGFVVDSMGFEFAFDHLEYFVAFGGLFVAIFLLFKAITYNPASP